MSGMAEIPPRCPPRPWKSPDPAAARSVTLTSAGAHSVHQPSGALTSGGWAEGPFRGATLVLLELLASQPYSKSVVIAPFVYCSAVFVPPVGPLWRVKWRTMPSFVSKVPGVVLLKAQFIESSTEGRCASPPRSSRGRDARGESRIPRKRCRVRLTIELMLRPPTTFAFQRLDREHDPLVLSTKTRRTFRRIGRDPARSSAGRLPSSGAN